jgi:hypothetical protein
MRGTLLGALGRRRTCVPQRVLPRSSRHRLRVVYDVLACVASAHRTNTAPNARTEGAPQRDRVLGTSWHPSSRPTALRWGDRNRFRWWRRIVLRSFKKRQRQSRLTGWRCQTPFQEVGGELGNRTLLCPRCKRGAHPKQARSPWYRMRESNSRHSLCRRDVIPLN